VSTSTPWPAPQFARALLEPGLVARDERQIVTPPRQLAREFGSDTG